MSKDNLMEHALTTFIEVVKNKLLLSEKVFKKEEWDDTDSDLFNKINNALDNTFTDNKWLHKFSNQTLLYKGSTEQDVNYKNSSLGKEHMNTYAFFDPKHVCIVFTYSNPKFSKSGCIYKMFNNNSNNKNSYDYYMAFNILKSETKKDDNSCFRYFTKDLMNGGIMLPIQGLEYQVKNINDFYKAVNQINITGNEPVMRRTPNIWK